MTSEVDIILRLAVATGLGLVIGYERERQNQTAGLRTHMVLVIGAALAMIISINLATEYREIAPNGDPARLAAQVISGIGFLGAGAILRYGTNVIGLTTATSMWTMAIVGLAIGAGYFLAGIATTAILFVILAVVNIFEEKVISTYNTVHLIVEADDQADIVTEIKAILTRRERNVRTFGLDRNLEQSTLMIDVMLRIWHNETPEGIVAEIAKVEGVRRVKVSE
ncbi:MAG: MgtC/SapB family protein [Chloroflexi bacterium]|jgi:putative Mg2+ transporter-C (MgtC) family protein|nr:MgtC/SapB family protein [Chloroflexota bacterium]